MLCIRLEGLVLQVLNLFPVPAREYNSFHVFLHLNVITKFCLPFPGLNFVLLLNTCYVHYFEEKGKLKHAVISPYPGETKNITSFKIASHPNIFVLDTPGVLPPEVTDDRVCSNLALTGAIRDCVVGEIELAQYFLSILSLSDEYKKWGKLVVVENGRASINQGASILASSESGKRQDRQYPTDHTQDFIVNNVRRALFEAISSFAGNAENEEDLARLIEVEFKVLHRVFHLPKEFDHDENYGIVATKLLNLYRTGRLGHYTLDPFPKNAWCSSSEMI
ncbi:DAR GTPase 2, mitochondrial [Olea europaea subsp. europaea]|uniref:DAR GTPase 2, mitochondrial n=1 Tax=Olea europaea subsp. europaea TaxID=158383 RepID=A0A8S0UYZ7_OLEEU|nr:DAR GTPase 2, mitochondrial [Olea europaea subsp. europaea]